MAMTKTIMYLYFAYGSNLLGSRMKVQNPDALRVGAARLDDHRLDFNFESTRWGGYAATIVPDIGRQVWGALWQVSDLESLDRQEGVDAGIYEVRHVNVINPDNSTVKARTYQLVKLPTEVGKNKPSRIYLETILQGAKESKLPEEYFGVISKIVHNGFEGPVTVKNFNISFVETKQLVGDS